jgi:hypothetical protein
MLMARVWLRLRQSVSIPVAYHLGSKEAIHSFVLDTRVLEVFLSCSRPANTASLQIISIK